MTTISRHSSYHELYRAAARIAEEGTDLHRTAEDLSQLLADHWTELHAVMSGMGASHMKLMVSEADRRMHFAQQANLALLSGSLGWAEYFSYCAACRRREQVELAFYKNDEKKIVFDYGTYFLDDFIFAFVRGAIQLKALEEERRVNWLSRTLKRATSDRLRDAQRASLEMARMNAMWIKVKALEHERSAGISHPVLHGLAQRILDRVADEAKRLDFTLAPQPNAEDMLGEEFSKIGTQLPRVPAEGGAIDEWDEVTPVNEEQERRQLSHRAQQLIEHVVQDFSKGEEPSKATQFILAMLTVYWGDDEFAHRAKDALTYLWQQRLDQIDIAARSLLLTPASLEAIGNEYEQDVIGFIHDLARAGLYYEGARMVKRREEKISWLANISTASLHRFEELNLPTEICDYVQEFRKLVRIEHSKLNPIAPHAPVFRSIK